MVEEEHLADGVLVLQAAGLHVLEHLGAVVRVKEVNVARVARVDEHVTLRVEEQVADLDELGGDFDAPQQVGELVVDFYVVLLEHCDQVAVSDWPRTNKKHVISPLKLHVPIHWNGKNNHFRFSLFSLYDFFWRSGKVIFSLFKSESESG